MSKLESYTLRVEPMGWTDGDRVYRITIVVDGEIIENTMSAVEIPPNMNELEIIERMNRRIIETMKEKYENTSGR